MKMIKIIVVAVLLILAHKVNFCIYGAERNDVHSTLPVKIERYDAPQDNEVYYYTYNQQSFYIEEIVNELEQWHLREEIEEKKIIEFKKKQQKALEQIERKDEKQREALLEEHANLLRDSDEQPDSIEPRMKLATYYYRSGELSKARDEYEAVLQLDPANTMAKMMLEIINETLTRIGQEQEITIENNGESNLEDSILHKQDRQQTYYHRINQIENHLDRMQRVLSKEKIFQWKHDIENMPDAIEPRLQLAKYYIIVGDLMNARILYEEVLSLEPDNALAANGMDTIIKTKENIEKLESMAKIYYHEGNSNMAESISRIILLYDPNNITAQNLLSTDRQ